MKFTYKNKMAIVTAMRIAKDEMWRYIELKKNISRFLWKRDRRKYSLNHYNREQYQYLKIELIKEPIKMLEELCKSKSKYVDFDELISDLSWIKIYYEEKRWSSVIRWFSNIETTLNRDFSDYMDEIKALPTNPYTKSKETT